MKAGARRPTCLLCRCSSPAPSTQHWARCWGPWPGQPRALLPRGIKGLSLSWAFLTLETVQSYEFLKHSICLVSRGRELTLQPAPQPGAPAAWSLPTSQKTLCLFQAPMLQGVVLTALGTATLGRAHMTTVEKLVGSACLPSQDGMRLRESERKPPCKGENHLQINI